MKLLLLIALIGIEATYSNCLTFSFARDQDIEDELENLDYPQSRESGADERDPAAWELWDRQTDETEAKDADNPDSFTDDKTNDDFEKPVQSAVKRASGPEQTKTYHPTVIQIDPLSSDVNRNNLDRKNNGKNGGQQQYKMHPTRCPPHAQFRTPCPTSHRHPPPLPARGANYTHTTEATETILVQEPYRLDTNDVYSVCDVDGNWSWPLSPNESKRWLRWLWVLPCLLLGILMFLLFVKTCQNYAEQRAQANAHCRNKMCHYQDPCRDPRQSASSPLIRKLEPHRYKTTGVVGKRPVRTTPMGQMMSQMGPIGQMSHMTGQMGQMPPMGQMSQMTHMNQMSQIGPLNQMSQIGPLNQMGQRASQMSQMQMHRRQSIGHACPPRSPQPQRMPSMSSNLSKIGKTQKLIYTSSPPQFTVRTSNKQSACPCPRPQPYYGTPPPQTPQQQYTPLQQQCMPPAQQLQMQQQMQQQNMQQQMQHAYADSRPSRVSQYTGFVAPGPGRVSPRLNRERKRTQSSPNPPSSPSGEGSRSPSPKLPS